jgi:hypothetical protein
MWLLPRIGRHVAIQQLPVLGIAVHVVSAAGILYGTATLAAVAGPFDCAQDLHAVRDPKKWAHWLQSIARRVAGHRHESLEICASVGNASLLATRASPAEYGDRDDYGEEYFHAEIIV